MPVNESQGIKIYCSTSTAASTNSSDAVGYLTGFNGPQGSANTIDITSFDSTAKEFLMGLADWGSVSMDFMIDLENVGQKNLRDARSDRAQRKIVIMFNDSTSEAAKTRMIFGGYVLSYNMQGGVDEPVKGSAEIKMTGGATFSTSTI